MLIQKYGSDLSACKNGEARPSDRVTGAETIQIAKLLMGRSGFWRQSTLGPSLFLARATHMISMIGFRHDVGLRL